MSVNRDGMRRGRGLLVGVAWIGFFLGPGVWRAEADSLGLPAAAQVAALTPVVGAPGMPGPPGASVASGALGASGASREAALPATVVRSAKGKRFHRPGCKAARGAAEAMGRAEALAAGLTACRRCLGVPVKSARVAGAPRRRVTVTDGSAASGSGPGSPTSPAARADHGSPAPPARAPWDDPGTLESEMEKAQPAP